MHILVFGAGAIGGYLASKLVQDEQQVTLLGRAATTQQLTTNGLTIEEGERITTVNPEVVSSLTEAFAGGRRFDLIVMALKSYDMADALKELLDFEPEVSTILTVQNGIGVELPYTEAFGASRIVAGSLTTPVSKKSPTHLVVERDDRGLAIAPARLNADIDSWHTLFNSAEIETISLGDYHAMKWSKAFLNILSNATSAILDMPPAAVYANPDLFDLEVAMLQETLAVMNGQNIPVVNLPGSAAQTLARAVRFVPRFLLKPILTRVVASGRGDKMPSFYIDLESGRGKSEVVFHNGAIAQTGEALGIATPVNRALNDTLMALTQGELERRAFRHNPARLLAEI